MSVKTNYLIPLVNVPQVFQIALAGVTYTMTVKWNEQGQFWCADIADANEVPIVSCMPFITGADLLDGLKYLGFGGSFYILTDGASPFDVPTLENLGIDSNLYFQTVTASA